MGNMANVDNKAILGRVSTYKRAALYSVQTILYSLGSTTTEALRRKFRIKHMGAEALLHDYATIAHTKKQQ